MAAASQIAQKEARALQDAYRFLSRARNRLFLRSGLAQDSLPSAPAESLRLARALGFASADHLRERHRHHARQVRAVYERVFLEERG
ncbi:MAG: hypothetical protein IT210_05070 [Armatimonadetes bacterium]|nr:hypothetical protein [Armatimonadota bacterium]